MSLKETLTAYWLHIQEELLPWLDDTTCGPLSGHTSPATGSAFWA